VGRAISLAESGSPEGVLLLKSLYPCGGRARIVGFTGPPGAGKSTLIEAVALRLLEGGARVGIVAVDPTSPFTGGALLGDRIRMQALYLHPRAFIRSMATRGNLGGLSAMTLDAVDILDAAGFDWILVETIGVGQDEVDVASCVQAVALVLVPGLGDDIQALKAGVMEIADLFVVNKADREGADQTAAELETLIRMGVSGVEPPPPIVKTVAPARQGIEELVARLEEVHHRLSLPGRAREKALRRARARLSRLVEGRFSAHIQNSPTWSGKVEAVASRRTDPYSACEAILKEALC
jgi:LAO/AO transport system kinase